MNTHLRFAGTVNAGSRELVPDIGIPALSVMVNAGEEKFLKVVVELDGWMVL